MLPSNERMHILKVAIFASDEAKLFIERPELFSDFILGGKHNKFLTEKLFHRNTEKISVDAIICEGKLQKMELILRL